MAILKDLEVSIAVGDHDLPEYEEEGFQEAPDSMVKYVEATSGESFVINLRVLPKFRSTSQGLKFEVFLDGRYVENVLVMFDDFPRRSVTGWKYKIHGIMRRNGKDWTQRSFRFRDITILEEAPSLAYLEQETTLVATIGNIVVKVFRISNDPENEMPAPCFDDVNILNETSEIHEKSLKKTTISQSINLGTAIHMKARSTISAKYTDGRDCPLATFIFKYRSLKALKDLLLIPRTPPPAPLEDRPVDSLSQEELKTLVERLKARTIKTEKQVKRQRSEDDGDIVEIVHSRPSKKAHMLDTEEAIVISDGEEG